MLIWRTYTLITRQVLIYLQVHFVAPFNVSRIIQQVCTGGIYIHLYVLKLFYYLYNFLNSRYVVYMNAYHFLNLQYCVQLLAERKTIVNYHHFIFQKFHQKNLIFLKQCKLTFIMHVSMHARASFPRILQIIVIK